MIICLYPHLNCFKQTIKNMFEKRKNKYKKIVELLVATTLKQIYLNFFSLTLRRFKKYHP